LWELDLPGKRRALALGEDAPVRTNAKERQRQKKKEQKQVTTKKKQEKKKETRNPTTPQEREENKYKRKQTQDYITRHHERPLTSSVVQKLQLDLNIGAVWLVARGSCKYWGSAASCTSMGLSKKNAVHYNGQERCTGLFLRAVYLSRTQIHLL